MSQDRIAAAFARAGREGRPALVLYVVVGHPSVEDTLEVVPALEQAGADIIELGVPFSDPVAEGPTIQEASYHALQQGVTPHTCVETAAALRARGVTAPLLFMGYYNPVLAYGLPAWARDCHEAGVDGLIVPDLPADEAMPLREALAPYALHLVPLLAPTSTDARIALACRHASGFVYCVSVTGVTGAREELAAGVEEMVARVRRHTSLPVVVGFGVSRREHVETLGRWTDGVVVGSALVRAVGQPGTRQERVRRVRELVAELRGLKSRA